MPELRTETIDGETWTEHPTTIYCRECQRRTHPAAETIDTPGTTQPRCWVCGDGYQCDTCGAAIMPDGDVFACEDHPAH